MSFIKIGESTEISKIESTESCIPSVNAEVLENFRKTAKELKRIAPKADDFLYFTAIMMHAAEASALNNDGTPKLTPSGEKVVVGWNKANNTWRWETNDASVKPYKNCFPPGTKILMGDGSVKNIEDVKVGDKVITHKGRVKKVLRRFITPHKGNLVELSVNNNVKIASTDNHPFYKLNVVNDNWKSDTSPFRIWNEKGTTKEFSFAPIKDLTKKDFVLSINPSRLVKSNINANQARLLGLYAAEGSLNKNSSTGKYRNVVTFTFSNKEYSSLGLLTKSLLESEFPGVKVTIRQDEKNHKCSVEAHAKDIYKFFLKNAGTYSHSKKLSKEIVFGSEEVKKQFLLGWLEGDGNVAKDSGRITGTTVSPSLASQTRLMMYSLGIHNTIYETAPSKSLKNGRNIIGNHNVFRVRVNSTNGKKLLSSEKLEIVKTSNDRNLTKFVDNYCLHRILDKTEKQYEGDVYNLEVADDNSYIANWVVVSNCNGDIFPEEELVKAYKKWVGKPLCIDHKSSSVDHTRGFIVDTYYDRNLKRVVALCALDKANYPELARKVATGYSNNVSMGTAVGRAICSDCAKVAKTEADFCDHMKKKSCYGEINVDLNPIELSIVVNGADPQAKIREVLAAAKNLDNYLESKQNSLNKVAAEFTASFSMTDQSTGESTNINLKSNSLEEFEKDVNEAVVKLQKIVSDEDDLVKDTTNKVSDQLESLEESSSEGSVDFAEKSASFKDALAELNKVSSVINERLVNMKEILDKLASNKQEENMSGSKDLNKNAYYQGTEEPKPGQAQYSKDPLNEKLRAEDKHMVGQMDTGPVDGMHPGPDSVGMSELERKKMLARAEAEDRAMKRNAAVELAKKALQDKQAYWNNSTDSKENPGTPKPGERKYPVDKMNEDLRDKDKHMVGQKPFPGVGSVDGLHPSPDSADVSDELKRKQMLSRAGLRARFVKASSSWEVFDGDKLVLTASVSELSNGNSDKLYSTIATKEFGKKLIEKIKVHGADKVRAMVKKAQQEPAPAAPPPAPSGAAPELPPGDMPDMPQAEPPADGNKSGDPKENAVELAEKMRDMSSDLVEAVRGLTGEKAEMGAEEGAEGEMPKAASFSTRHLQSMRRELNGALTEALKECVAQLNSQEEELKFIANMYNKGIVSNANSELVEPIVEDAIQEGKTTMANAYSLMEAFVKYARGTQAIVKRAQAESELHDMLNSKDSEDEEDFSDLMPEEDENSEIMRILDGDYEDEHEEEHEHEEYEHDYDHVDDNDADVNVTVPAEKLKDMPAGTTKMASFDTKEGRAALRAKLAGEALKFSPMLDEAHPKGGVTLDYGSKPSGDLGKFEDLEETHEAVLDLAQAPVKVRKEAEAIRTLIAEGKLDASDLDQLVAEGLDKDAVAYYRKYFSQVDGGSEFASELVKEHVKAQLEENLDVYKIKMARAYELAYDMVERGLCHNDRLSVSAQVEELMNFSDENFESFKKVVAKQDPLPAKYAGKLPSVGMLDSGDTRAVQGEPDLVSQLSAILSKSNKRMF